MGEVFHALQYLNRTMNLGLDARDLLRAEMGFKSRLEMVGNPAERFAGDPVALAENYETVTVLRPRAEKLDIGKLQKFATAHVKADLKKHVVGKPDISLEMLDARAKVTKVTAATKVSVATKVSPKVSGAAIKKTPTR